MAAADVMTPREEEGTPLAIERFPPALRRRLRVLAAVHGTTMRQLLLEAAYAHAGLLERADAENEGAR